jgi:hypothetical protein
MTEVSDQAPDERELARRKRRGKPPPPIQPTRKHGGRKGIAPWIVWHFADTGKFHSLKDIIAKLDPTGEISRKAVETTIGTLKRAGLAGVEMQPGAFGNNRYRFSGRTERLISLDEIEQKFVPVIEDLLKQATLPVSHQSSGRFRAAAATLKGLLDQWAE